MFKLRIETNNAAFEGENKIPEIVKILKEAILRLERGNDEIVLYDTNGNNVGNYKLTKR